MTSASAEVEGRNRSTAAHTGVPAQINNAVCYHQNLSNDKLVTIPGHPCDNSNVTCGVFPTSGAAFLHTARATRRPQSSRMNARQAEALSSVSELLLIKLVSRSLWQGSKHPL